MLGGVLGRWLQPRTDGTFKSVDVGQPEGVDVLELNGVPVDGAGYTAPVSFEVPPDTQAVLVTVTGAEDTRYIVSELVDASGQMLRSAWANNLGLGEDSMRVFAGQQSHGAMVPNSTVDTPKGPLPAGTWSVRAYGHDGTRPASGTVDVRVFLKRGKEKPPHGHLDVHLHFAGKKGLDAQSAPTDPLFQRALEEFRRLFATADIDVAFTYEQAPDGFDEVDFGENPEVPDVFELYRQTPETAGMHLFVVDSLGDSMPGVGGLSGGIPGNPVGGTKNSGVVARWSTTPEENIGPGFTEKNRATLLRQLEQNGSTSPEAIAAMNGVMMAHETAHFLGLFHTAETKVDKHDGLDGTEAGDAANVMRPNTPNPKVLTPTFTEEQGEKLRQSPLVETTD
jgi:hypothetical protein